MKTPEAKVKDENMCIIEYSFSHRQSRTTLDQLRERTILNPITQCWEWQGAKDSRDYGSLTVKSKRKIAPRYVKELLENRLLANEEHVRHTCDNPCCINPDHLLLGTRLDNLNDMRERGRACNPPINRGEKNNNTKFTEDIVRYIRQTKNDKSRTTESLAKEFGVDRHTISNIVSRKTWGWLQ